MVWWYRLASQHSSAYAMKTSDSASSQDFNQQPEGPKPSLVSYATRMEPKERDMNRLYSSLIAGVGSGALASIICAPLDLIRTRLQVWNDVKHSPTVAMPQMIRDIIKKDGITGCFRGLGATLVTVPVFWGVYWPVYDDCKRKWKKEYPNWNPMFLHMASAVTAGVISDIICNPMFVVRTRLQTEALHSTVSNTQTTKLSMAQTARALYVEGGPLIFWRGSKKGQGNVRCLLHRR